MARTVASFQVRDILEGDSDLGLSFGSNLFIGPLPDNIPELCVGLIDNPGTKDALGYEERLVQILIRGSVGGYENASMVGNMIENKLHRYRGEITSDPEDSVMGIFVLTGFFYIGSDEEERPILSSTFIVKRR